MRPLELRIRNFRSYFGESVFDFRDRTLVGVVGPIGSGKSSMLDAVCFALYGRTPNAGTATKALIHQRAQDGGTLLRFEVDGEIWEAVRSLRRSGQSQHALYRYDEDDPRAEAVERHTLEGEVNERVVSLLGLDYDTFGRSVLLAQNRFAEFLRARPGERDAVLKGVFGHDRIDLMREAAKQRAVAVEAALAAVAAHADRLEQVAARLVELEVDRAAAEDTVELLRKAEPRVVDLDAAMTASRADHDAATSRLLELRRHEGRLPDPAVTERLLGEAGAAAERRRRLAAETETARSELDAGEEALSAARAGGEEAILDEAARLVAAVVGQRRSLVECEERESTIAAHVTEIEGELAVLADRLASAEAAVTRVEEELAAATRELTRAEEAHHDAQHRDMAATLRSALAEGAACPVCEQHVSTVPAASAAVDVARAVDALERAHAGRRASEEARATTLATLEGVKTGHEGARTALARLAAQAGQAAAATAAARTELDATLERLGEILGAGDPVELLDARRRRHGELAETAAAARRRWEQIRGRHESAIQDEHAVGAKLDGLRREVIELATRLDTGVAGSLEAVDVLGRAVDDLRKDWRERTESLEAAALDSQRRLAGAAAELSEVLEQLGVEPPFAGALAKAEARSGHLDGEVARFRDELADGEALIEQRERLEGARDRYRRIAGDLTDARFVRFLLDDERSRLADLGSDHFQRLTSGRYRFTEDGTFSIVDLTTADAVRKASSLSGGETFLASLALALSLAEMVTRTGGRLDAFFLDEGFGSLDPEHLDLAMEGIEALVADDDKRLVVVVSHVPEMGHRIEDLVQLDRDPLTGDTRVLRA